MKNQTKVEYKNDLACITGMLLKACPILRKSLPHAYWLEYLHSARYTIEKLNVKERETAARVAECYTIEEAIEKAENETVKKITKLPKAVRHKDTGAVEYINKYGTYRAKGLNGSAYDYDEHYKGGYRPINITFHDFVVGVTFSSSTPNDLKKKGFINDLNGYREQYETGYILPNVPWL